jgi:hypothetical protein
VTNRATIENMQIAPILAAAKAAPVSCFDMRLSLCGGKRLVCPCS